MDDFQFFCYRVDVFLDDGRPWTTEFYYSFSEALSYARAEKESGNSVRLVRIDEFTNIFKEFDNE